MTNVSTLEKEYIELFGEITEVVDEDARIYAENLGNLQVQNYCKLVNFVPHLFQFEVLKLFHLENIKTWDVLMLLTSRRWGKTEVLSHILGMLLMIPRSKIGILSPSNTASERIFNKVITQLGSISKKLEEMGQEALDYEVLSSKQTIKIVEIRDSKTGKPTKWSQITCASVKSIDERLIGDAFSFILVDEAFIISDKDFRYLYDYADPTFSTYPLFTDKDGNHIRSAKWAFISTPRGRLGASKASQIYLQGKSPKYPSYKTITMTLDQNPLISDEEKAKLRRENSKDRFNQEYMCQFVENGSTVLYNFDERIHTKKIPLVELKERKEDLELISSTDIGYSDGSGFQFWLYDRYKNKYYLVEEYYSKQTLNREVAKLWHQTRTKWIEYFELSTCYDFCDPAVAEYRAMVFKDYNIKLIKAYNSRKDGFDTLNDMLEQQNHDGEPDIYIDESCTETQRQYLVLEFKVIGGVTSESYATEPEGSHGEMIDCTRYAILSHIRLNKKGKIIVSD